VQIIVTYATAMYLYPAT